MPKMDGYETTRNIREKTQYDQIPIIAMTANAMKEDIQKSREAGMQGHISKPVDPEILYQNLSQYLKLAHDDVAENINSQPLPQPQSWPQSIPGLNIERGIKQVGGNEKLYQKLLIDFLHNHEHLRKDLRIYLQQNELEQATRAVHTLKGVSGNIGAEKLYQIASEIDRKLKLSQNIENELIDEFIRAYDELCDGIHLLQSNSPIEENNLAAETIEAHHLLASLNNGDATSHALLDRLNPELKQKIGQQNIQRLYSFIEDYEFQLAAEELEKIIKGTA